MNLSPADEIVIPAYICDSVLGPLESLGLFPRFAPTTADLSIQPEALESVLTPRSRAVLVPHYFGFPTKLDEIIQFCRDREIRVIEDCAHALYSFDGAQPIGRSGDIAVFSPWKSLPIPDGGVLVVNDPNLSVPEVSEEPGALEMARRVAYRALPTIETAIGWTPRLRILRNAQFRGAIQDRDRSPDFARTLGSRFSYQLLQHSPGVEIRAKRRHNYTALESAVASHSSLRLLKSTLPDGVCPLGLPMLAPDRETARDHFISHGINVRAYWDRLPREVRRDQFPDAFMVSEHILILPVHQSLTARQLEHIIRAIETVPGGALR